MSEEWDNIYSDRRRLLPTATDRRRVLLPEEVTPFNDFPGCALFESLLISRWLSSAPI